MIDLPLRAKLAYLACCQYVDRNDKPKAISRNQYFNIFTYENGFDWMGLKIITAGWRRCAGRGVNGDEEQGHICESRREAEGQAADLQ